MPILCRCPPDSRTPRSPTLVSKPLGNSFSMNSRIWAASAAARTAAGSISFSGTPNAMFAVTVSSIRKISCGTYPIPARQARRFPASSGTPSTRMRPAVGVCRPNSRSTKVDLPDPVSPTIPSDEFFGITKSSPSITGRFAPG